MNVRKNLKLQELLHCSENSCFKKMTSSYIFASLREKVESVETSTFHLIQIPCDVSTLRRVKDQSQPNQKDLNS